MLEGAKAVGRNPDSKQTFNKNNRVQLHFPSEGNEKVFTPRFNDAVETQGLNYGMGFNTPNKRRTLTTCRKA